MSDDQTSAWRKVTTALGYGDGITEPQISPETFLTECERQFGEAAEWRESQQWRVDCHLAGHPDDEDCHQHDPALRDAATIAELRDRLEFIEQELEHERDGRGEWFERAQYAEAEVRRLRADNAMGATNLAYYRDLLDSQAGEVERLRMKHHEKCFQRRAEGIPDDLPADLCDCRILWMLEGATGRFSAGITCPTECVTKNHPGREHEEWLRWPEQGERR